MSTHEPSLSAWSASLARAAQALALTVALTTAPTGAHAQTGPDTVSAFADSTRPVTFLKETVVTGARYPRAFYESPQALSFLSRSQISEAIPNVPGDVLASMPGVDNSKDSPWEQRPVLRGLGGQRVLVLVDGMPMNSARGNGPHPSLVGPSQIERVEVVRGPSSVAYGSDALGGAINIITREASFLRPDQTFRGSASIGGSTADEQGNMFLELMKRAGKLSAYVSSGARNAQNYRSPDGDIPNSQFSDYDALANLRYDFTSKTALKLGWQLYRGDDIGIPGLSFAFPGASQDFGFDFYNRDYAHLTLSHSHTNSWLASTQLKGYWQQERRNFDSDQDLEWFMFPAFGFPTVGPPTGAGDTASVSTHQDRYFDISTVGLQGQLTSVRTSRALFTAGIDAARDMTDGDNVRFRTYQDPNGAAIGGTSQRVTSSIPDGDFDNYGAYAQSEWYLRPQWTLHAGGRYTHYRYRTEEFTPAPNAPVIEPMSVDDDALSGSAGMVWNPARDLHVSGNVANGYRAPNAQDLFFNGPASVGNVIGNPNLTPEKSLSYDLGLRWGPGRLGLAANAFYSTYEDLIDALQVPGPPGPPTFQYTNISEARIWGYEVEAEWKFRPQWNGRANVSDAIGDITNAEAIENLYGVSQDQAPLPSVPPIHGAFSVRWTDTNGRYWVEPSARWSWRTARLPLPTPGVEQFTEFKSEWIVGDLFAGAALPWGARLMAGVRNIADTPYRPALASADEPGINFVGQLTAGF